MERVHPEWPGLKEIIGHDILAKFVWMSVAKSRDRDMRMELPLISRDTRAVQRRVDLVLQKFERLRMLYPHPKGIRPTTRREMSDTAEGQFKRVHIDRVKGADHIVKNAAVNFAYKPKCQMELFGFEPARTGETTAYPDQMVRDFDRQIETDKQAVHSR